MQQPSLVISHLHMPIVKLQQQTIMPFIMQQQLVMLPASIVHRFCRAEAAILSSQTHIIFMPPAHFSIVTLQRGTMAKFMPVGTGIPVAGALMPEDIIPVGVIMAFIHVSCVVHRTRFRAVRRPNPGPTSLIIRSG